MAKKEEIEKEINVIIESPWKKIVIVGIVIIAFVIATEVISRYFEDNQLSSIYKIFLSPGESGPFYTTPYFLYAIIALVAILVIILILILFKRKKNLEVENNEVKKPINITDKEIKKVLIRIDSLLEKLPEDEINKFAKSGDAKLFKAVLKKYGVK